MQIIIEIPEAQRTRILNALAKAWNYQEVVDGEPNNQTKAQFIRQVLIQNIKRTVHKQEVEEATQALSINEVEVT